MILTLQEYSKYLNAHLKLLHYCYCQKNKKEISFKKFSNKPLNVKFEARNYFLNNNQLLNKYLKEKEDITSEEKEILSGFNRKITSKFIILKQLKNHAIFMDIESEKFYAVNALSDSFVQLLEWLPVLVETTILPFNDKIIYDGFFVREIYIGKNMELNLLNQYKQAKALKQLIKSIEK